MKKLVFAVVLAVASSATVAAGGGEWPVARAPADAATLVVLLNAEGQSPDELATFLDVKACLLKDIGQ